MGLECACTLIKGRAMDAGVAHLDCNELRFKGESQVKLITAGAKATVSGEILSIEGPIGSLRLRLDDATIAARWADKINNPRSRLQKMGIEAGAKVWMIGMDDPVFVDEFNALVDEPFVTKPAKGAAYDAIVLVARAVEALKQLSKCALHLAPKGAVLVLWPKGRKDLRHEEVVGAGREAGFSQTRSMAFNDELTALRLVKAKG